MDDGKTYGERSAEKTSVVTIMGVDDIEIDHGALNDFEVLELTMTLNDQDSTDLEKTRALAEFGPLVFGSKEWKRIKSELRKQNDGKLTTETAVMFIYATMYELGALKNS